MSVTREAVACYRLYAANCVELAELIPELDRRVFLLNMARDWLKMADQAERNDGAGRTEKRSALRNPHPQSAGSLGTRKAPAGRAAHCFWSSRACGYRLGWQRPRNQPILRMPSSRCSAIRQPMAARAVRRCETHAAVVFLAGDRALKVKRAVRYPFLDYSTLDKRKAACQAELDVNRKFAPQLYRRIVPIVRRADGSLALDGAGATIEWAVEMTRFDEDKTLDHLAERGELDEALSRQARDRRRRHACARRARRSRAVARRHCAIHPRQYRRVSASTASCSRPTRSTSLSESRRPPWQNCARSSRRAAPRA